MLGANPIRASRLLGGGVQFRITCMDRVLKVAAGRAGHRARGSGCECATLCGCDRVKGGGQRVQTVGDPVQRLGQDRRVVDIESAIRLFEIAPAQATRSEKP